MEDKKEYVTCEECEKRRAEIYRHNNKQDNRHTAMETKMGFLERAFWTIFATLITGFAGVIFAVLSLGN